MAGSAKAAPEGSHSGATALNPGVAGAEPPCSSAVGRCSCRTTLENGGWNVSERRVKAFLIVDALEKLADAGANFRKVAIFVAIHLLVFQRLHERFAGRVVIRIAFAAHADLDSVLFQLG